MTKLTPRQIKALETKKKILDTSLHLFTLRGYNQVTVDEIVKESGTSKGAFYNHFQSKYEIFLEKFKEIDDFYVSFQQTISLDLNSTEKILTFINAQMTFIQNQLGKEVMKVIYINVLNPNPHNYLLDENRHMYNILKDFVTEGRNKQELRSDLSMESMIKILTRSMRGCIYDWCMSGAGFDLVKESRTFFMVVLQGFQQNTQS
ncbi:TetR/AcrR family transcriptional regulator [Ectobacillus sp. sgz5001026]|uniref:TetR/AcrR family transcriptional regulator n=1 Tax=Ectobacillus sp. sgz5001026 TaxID=3242473 RepID=UPI0036D20A31